jgi:hypothetical protein
MGRNRFGCFATAAGVARNWWASLAIPCTSIAARDVMALIPVIIIIGLVTFLLVIGWSTFGVLPSVVLTLLLVGIAVGLFRLLRGMGLAGTPDAKRDPSKPVAHYP